MMASLCLRWLYSRAYCAPAALPRDQYLITGACRRRDSSRLDQIYETSCGAICRRGGGTRVGIPELLQKSSKIKKKVLSHHKIEMQK